MDVYLFDSRTVAQHIVAQLQRWGCKRIYGVIGDANLYLLDELAKQDVIQYIACRHETTAALMASAEAKITGKLSVCTATSGPGVTSLLNGLADADSDHAPVLAITGQVERSKLGTGSKQEIDQQRLLDPIAEYSVLVAEADALPYQLNIAMKTATARGGVAHLSIPKDVWKLTTVGPLFPPPPSSPKVMQNNQDFIPILKTINQAKKPVMLVGRGIRQAQPDVLSLAEKIKAPVIVTMPAKPYFPNDHPLFVGGLGQAGSEVATKLLKESDCCIILGSTWWPEDYVPKHVSIVQIDAATENIGRKHPNVAAMIGDLPYLISEMIYGLEKKENPEWMNQIQQEKEEWNKRIQAEIKQEQTPLAPQRVMVEINRCIDRDAIISVDVGDHTLWFQRIFQLEDQEVLISGNWRTLGFGLPAAMAAKLNYPQRQSIAIVGDGGFMTTAVDLITAVAIGLSITIFLINNRSYAMEKNRMEGEGLERLGSNLINPDFVALAKAFGAEGIRIEKAEELESKIRQALDSSKVILVEIICDDTVVPHTKI